MEEQNTQKKKKGIEILLDPNFELDVPALEERLKEINECKEILEQRYKECDEDGHKEFLIRYTIHNENGNEQIIEEKYDENKEEEYKDKNPFIYCSHCYRRKKYTSPRTDKEYNERDKNLNIFNTPMDAPIRMRKAREEVSHQKSQDWNYGLRKISEELKKQEKENNDSTEDKYSSE